MLDADAYQLIYLINNVTSGSVVNIELASAPSLDLDEIKSGLSSLI